MTNDLDLLHRFRELSQRSYTNNQYTFTSFLSMAELSDFYEQLRLPRDHENALFPSGYRVFGGYENAERAVIRFGNPEEFMYEQDFPIVCICISPLNKKFSDNLSHRDFLGSLMNLGISRSELGDILVRENSAYVFATENIADFICRELTRIRHTSVSTRLCEAPKELSEPEFEELHIQAKSLRIDGITAKLTKLSRSKAAELFLQKKVFVNGRLMENESHNLSEGDIFSIRGYGKFRFESTGGNTKKGNLILNICHYV